MPVASLRLNPPERPLSPIFLDDLLHAHAKLLCATAELDTLTRGPLPSTARIIDARWNISRASLARRSLWGRIYDHLSNQTAKENIPDLRRLQLSDMALLRASSEHVPRWTINNIVQDWSAYCEASRSIRWKMKASIAAEQRIRYSMLEG